MAAPNPPTVPTMKPATASLLSLSIALSGLCFSPASQAENAANNEDFLRQWGSAASAPANEAAAQDAETTIRKAFSERYPRVPINSVTPTLIPGMYELWGGGQLFYVDQTGDYLLMGPLVDTRTRANLSQQRLAELTKVDFNSLPFDLAIPLVKGEGTRKLAVFSDPDCPFCKRLEKELAQMADITVYLFLLPLAELHPQATQVATDVWCSDDRAGSWRAYLLEGKRPETGKACDTPLASISKVAGELGISGTPAIILPNGRRIDGAVPAAKLEALLAGDK